MTWSIDVSHATAAISNARDRLTEVDAVAADVAADFSSAIAATAHAPRTAEALLNVTSDPFLVALAGMRRYVTNAADVADEVVAIYVAGDLEMAATTQKSMSEVAP